ncbi:MAG: S8 family peptidase [Tyzzerella sp.]|nr:S8 family peptidase [Tyzzerella sp.]
MPIDVCRERILSEDYRDFIVSELQEDTFAERFPGETCDQEMGEFYKSIYVEREQADPIQFDRYPYNSVPKCFTLLDMEALQQAGILQVQNYPTLELQGTGVLIGFVDTGIDYQNQIFRNLDGSTRIAGLWDQTIQEGTPPEGMFYGTEYSSAQIDEALRSETPLEVVPSRDENGHGTFLTSIAAGGANEENQFLGAAPDSQIAVVKLKPAKQYLKDFYLIRTDAPCYQENDIMLGITYLNQLADRLGLPLIICIALGTNMGSHAANSPLAGQLDIYANIANRAVVIGGGNEANQRHHYLGIAENVNDVKEVEIRVSEGVSGFCMELWSDPLNLLAVSVQSPSGERTYRFPIRSEETDSYTFVLERTTISIDYKVFVERLNAELVFFRVQNPTAGIWKVIVEPVQVEEGQFHMWLPVTEFLEGEVYFLQSNPDYTITEPGSTLSGMTVGFYDGNNNSIAIQSGRGYTRSERIKPDFAAPGVNVTGLAARGQFVARTGSSIAAGITAGAAALIMEWVVYRLQQKTIDSSQVRNLLVLGTEKTPNIDYPNREWGYGRLNVYNTFETIRRI